MTPLSYCAELVAVLTENVLASSYFTESNFGWDLTRTLLVELKHF